MRICTRAELRTKCEQDYETINNRSTFNVGRFLVAIRGQQYLPTSIPPPPLRIPGYESPEELSGRIFKHGLIHSVHPGTVVLSGELRM